MLGEVSNGRRARQAGMLVLLVSTAIGTAIPVQSAMAQAAQSQQVAQAAPQRAFNIAPQLLTDGLTAFGQQSGMQISVRGDLIRGLQTPGVTGTMTPTQALDRLLTGTGFGYSLTGPNSATLVELPKSSSAAVLPPVTVEGHIVNPNSTMTLMPEYAGGQIARGGQLGMLGNKDVMDTPFSQTNYTNNTIVNQQARTVQDVLMNDPSILTKQNSASDEDGSIVIRGFSHTLSSGNGSLNGLAGMAPLRTPDMDYMERVEVLRGPSALLNGMAAFGQGGVGGSYNLVTKKASDEPITEVTARYGSRMQLGTHVDLGRRFGAEKQFGIRANGAYREGDTAVEPGHAEVGSSALNLDYRGERVRISGDIAHQTNDANPQIVQQLVVSGVGGGIVHVPKAPDASNSLNPTWSKQPSRLTLGMVSGEVDLTEKVTAYAALGKQRLEFSLIGPNQPRLLGTDGTYGWNNVEHTNLSYDVLSMQGGLRAKAETGPVNHTFGLNLSQTKMETGESQATTSYSYTTNIYNPVFGGAVAAADPGAARKNNETRTSSIGIADTLSILDERVQFTAGVRQQRVESDAYNAVGAITSGYDSDALTPAVGLVVKPWQNVSLYANYVENLQKGTVVGSQYSNAGEVFAPYVSKQYETGVKVDLGTVTTTLAVFQIAQPNTVTISDTTPSRLALDGEVRNRGVELNSYGELTPGIRLMGGLTLIDSQQTKTQNGQYNGNREAGVPIIRTVVGGEWDTPFMKDLTLTGRFTYTGNQVASSSNENLKIPAWELLDLGARYVIDSPWSDKAITLRFNVDNVFDKNYWSGSNFRYVQLGAPRTFWLSATVDF